MEEWKRRKSEGARGRGGDKEKRRKEVNSKK